MQNELNTNKYFKLAYSANRCRCAVKSGGRERLPLGISVEGNPPPSLYAAPVVKNPPRKAHKDPVTAEVCTL
ncbi:Hypothetical protein FKW44_005970 [Caligus rogercresseyi]|uniref:Uncharacterized protein n=1 Tax=Caligus rogercresseyi TaxID=217165 RepID=A0A7T8KCR5_CALRO|nr:Hypothetical protein FKW44_005970 [Caligus rogercresseyi]